MEIQAVTEGEEVQPVVETEQVKAKAVKRPSKAHKVFHKIAKISSLISLILNIASFVAILFSFVGLIIAGAGVTSETLESSSELAPWATYLGINLWSGLYSWVNGMMAVSIELALLGFVFGIIQKVDRKQRGMSIAVFIIALFVMGLAVLSEIIGSIIYAQDMFLQFKSSEFFKLFF